MGVNRLHRLYVEVTAEEWRVITQLAMLRRTTTSDFLRDPLRLEPLIRAPTKRGLQLVERSE